MADDLFDVDNLNSVLRQIIKKKRVIDIKNYNVLTYSIPEDYMVKSVCFDSEGYDEEIRDAIRPIVHATEEKGCSETLFTALYEAVLNAYQHGNKREINKKVTIAHKVNNDSVEVAVVDEGGVIDSDFIPFVIRHREGRHEKHFLDYYDFSGKERPPRNNGTGTSFMHTYVDDISYFKSKQGGLVVHLTKKF
jgi:anti-sigma regulatory factor (Ser/Thr protein kinase)